MIVLILGESFRKWSIYEPKTRSSNFTPFNKNSFFFQGERNFYLLLAHTTVSFAAFIIVVLLVTELRWFIQSKRPRRYKAVNLIRALVISGCAKLLGLLGIVWHHVEPEPHNFLIHGYTILCLLTAYSGKNRRLEICKTCYLFAKNRYNFYNLTTTRLKIVKFVLITVLLFFCFFFSKLLTYKIKKYELCNT